MGVDPSIWLLAAQGTQGIASVGAGINQAQAYRAEADYASQAHKFNAQMADQQAQDALRRGEKSATAHARGVKRLIGAQRASYAAQGIDVNDGSALELQADTAALGAEDVGQIRMNAFLEAQGFKGQAISSRSAAKMAQISGRGAARSTLIASGLNLASTGLGMGYTASKMGGGGGGEGYTFDWQTMTPRKVKF